MVLLHPAPVGVVDVFFPPVPPIIFLMVHIPSLLGNRTIRTVDILNIILQEQLSIAVCVPKAGPKSESALEVFQFQVKDQTQAAQWQANVLNHVYKGKESIISVY